MQNLVVVSHTVCAHVPFWGRGRRDPAPLEWKHCWTLNTLP